MTDDINRFVEMAAVLDDRLPLRERVIEAQQAEIAKLNQIIALLIAKIESFSTLVGDRPAPLLVDPEPRVRRKRALLDATCRRCGAPFYAGRGYVTLCRRCRGERIQEGIAAHRPPWKLAHTG